MLLPVATAAGGAGLKHKEEKLGFIMVNQLTCLNLLAPPSDPRRESPLRAVYQTAADLMVMVIAENVTDEEYDGVVTGIITTALLIGRPLPSSLRLRLGKLLALKPSERSKEVGNDFSPMRREVTKERSDVFLLGRLLESLTAVIAAHEGTTS